MMVLMITYGASVGAGFTFFAVSVINQQLPPDLNALREPPSTATRVYSADGELIGEFFLEKRVVVGFDRFPEHVRQAFVSAEDGRFWEHPGFDPIGILRAARSNLRGGGSKQGASTITQQLTRMLMLSNERTYHRKMKELVLSVRVESELTKKSILEMYLNRVYLGGGAHGVQSAAEIYFGKDVGHLTLAESAMLAGLVQRPGEYSPRRNLKLAIHRQHYVLDRMRADGYLSDAQVAAAKAEPITLIDDELPLNHVAAPYFVEHVRLWAQDRFGEKSVYFGGLRVYTTLDMRAQRSAEAAVRDGLEALDQRLGFRGPLDHLDEERLQEFRAGAPRPYLPGLDSAALGAGALLFDDVAYVGAVVEKPRRGGVVVAIGGRDFDVERVQARKLLNWRGERDEETRRRQQLEIGDLIPVKLGTDDRGNEVVDLAQEPDVQGALLAMDQHTGAVRAMVGGYDFRQSQFDRATQGNRQIGSAFKPIIYGTAMSKGVTAVDIVHDAPITLRTSGGLWSPKNYDGKFHGRITLRTALAESLNTVSVRLVARVGVDAVIDMARKLGIQSEIPRHISIALGTPDLTLIEVASAYAAIANGGKKVPPQDSIPHIKGEGDAPRRRTPPGKFVELVTTDDGTILADYRDQVPTEQVIPPYLSYLIIDLMKVVVERGTGRNAQPLGRPTAGKTGTSTDWRDAWFMGYTADWLCGVWLGRDDFTPIGGRATGGNAALPIWLQFMQSAHPETPVRDFPIPEDIVLVRANELTGQPVPPGSSGGRLIPFARGSVPSRFAPSATRTRFGMAESFEPEEEDD